MAVSNPNDCWHINLETKALFDINEVYGLQKYQCIKYDNEDDSMYILANKHEGKIGVFLLNINGYKPVIHKYLVKWTNKLDIGDTNIYILRNKERHYKEIVICYKTIFINIFNIMVLDIHHQSDQTMMYRHESFQLWESETKGLLIQ